MGGEGGMVAPGRGNREGRMGVRMQTGVIGVDLCKGGGERAAGQDSPGGNYKMAGFVRARP